MHPRLSRLNFSKFSRSKKTSLFMFHLTFAVILASSLASVARNPRTGIPCSNATAGQEGPRHLSPEPGCP